MPFCTERGHQNPADARCCAQCGAALNGRRARPAEPTSTISLGGLEPAGAARDRELSPRRTRPVEALPPGRPCSWSSAARTRAAASCSTPRGHGRPASGQRHLPRRRHGLRRHADSGGPRGLPRRATSAASTAPTSTASRSTTRSCRTATRSRSASSVSSSRQPQAQA